MTTTQSEAPSLPLAGVRILDLARLGPGPHCSQILADFGADIINPLILLKEPAARSSAAWGTWRRWTPPSTCGAGSSTS